LKRKLLYRFVAILLSIFLAAHDSNAQETTVTDTVIQAAPDEEYDEETDEEQSYQDTLKSNFRSIVFDSVQAIIADKGFYYKRYMDSLLRATKLKAEKPRRTFRIDFFNSIFGIIFWIVAIGLFAYLVYRLFLSNSSLFSRSRKNISADIQVTSEDTNDPDTLLRNAIKTGNYRLAVRYLYLQALIRLAEKRFIEINANKTNYEYVSEVRRHKFANEFASLTLQYEYVWYGEYPVDENLFRQIEGSFLQFNKNYTR
jgi:hypothetical protein